MTERELFVKKYREVFNVDKSLFVNNDGKFQDEFCQKVYEIWQAATQRDGFKFVPVDLSDEQLSKIDDSFVDDDDYKRLYKLMIE